MGTFSVALRIAGEAHARSVVVDALVDTGASYTLLPARLLADLGVAPAGRRLFVLANGARGTRDVGEARVRVDGHEVTTVVVFGDDAAPALLGAVTLEEMGLGVDPPARRLIEVPGLLT